MNGDTIFRRIAAITAIISAPLALGASFVLLLAIDFDSEIISDHTALLRLDPPVAGTFRGVEFVGMFGYYLLLIPAAIYLWNWLKPKNLNLTAIYTLFGLGYIFIGAIGSALLFSVLPPIMSAYPQTSEAEREVLTAIFEAFFDAVIRGVYPLSYILGAAWWIGIGLILRAEQRSLGIFTAIMGLGVLGFSVGDVLQVEPLAALEVFTFLNPIWALWLGIIILRGVEESASLMEPAVAT